VRTGKIQFSAWFAAGLLLAAVIQTGAQTPPHLPPGGLLQLQVAQPAVDTSTPVTAAASFDPPVVRAGGQTFYRVSVTATESSIAWPENIAIPPSLKITAKTRGMITQTQVNSFRPLTTCLFELQATAAGHFTISNFNVDAFGARVEIPAATLDVLPETGPAPVSPAPRRLALAIDTTNLFLGQPVHVQVMLPAVQGNQIEAVREIQFIGDGLMIDKTATRMSAGAVSLGNQLKAAFVADLVVTPITAGVLKFSAQGFTAGMEFMPPFTMHGNISFVGGPPKYTLLTSDPVEIKVRPLPVTDEPPGFTGSIGRFFYDPPRLATNRLHVGEPVQLKLVFHGEGDLARLVPPAAPRAHDWQVIADPPPATSFTLIPLTDEVHETPAIPFSYFDPELGRYESLPIPPLPVTVAGEGLPTELPVVDDEGQAMAPLKLSAPAATPGQTAGSLRPPQERGWLALLLLVPVAGLLGLWQWDRRRRFLAAHPEIVRRARARRALRRERLELKQAAAAGDAAAYVQHAARAMRIAVAPHFPATPEALVSGDVLAQLDPAARTGQSGETVKMIFAAADAQYAGTPPAPPDLPPLRSAVDAVLQRLEEKL
jgi:hypothetical protein